MVDDADTVTPTAEKWRERAKLIRRHAEGMTDRPTARRPLLDLVERYEQLADSIDQSRWG
jgi:hypothetical protein